jgi:hypothetical protein
VSYRRKEGVTSLESAGKVKEDAGITVLDDAHGKNEGRSAWGRQKQYWR